MVEKSSPFTPPVVISEHEAKLWPINNNKRDLLQKKPHLVLLENASKVNKQRVTSAKSWAPEEAALSFTLSTDV